MIRKGDLFLGQVQPAWGTPETDLIGADYLEVLDSSFLNVISENEKNPTVSGSFGQNAPIIGAMRTECQLDFNMRSFGASTIADWVAMARAAGLTPATVTATGGNRYVLTPTALSATPVDITVWRYNNGQLIRAGNVMFDWMISAEINKKCLFSMTNGKGNLVALPSAAAYPTTAKIGTITPAVLPITKTILGSAVYSPLSFEISSNTIVEQRISGAGLGYGKSEITGREIDFKFQVYSEAPGIIDPYTAMRAGAESAISLVWGPATRQITIASASAVIQNVEESVNGNIVVWDITGVIADEDLTITVNSDLVVS